MPRDVRAIVFPAPGSCELRTLQAADPRPDQVVVETELTTVSPGTELRVLAGALESKDRFPVIPGYSALGRVSEVGADVRGWRVGDLVAAGGGTTVPGYTSLWGQQASWLACDPGSLVRLPEGAEIFDYALIELAAIAHRGITAAMPAAGEVAVVIGQGIIGALATRWLLRAGVRVVVTDLVPERLARANAWGVSGSVDGREPDAEARIRSLIGHGADIVVEASASIPGALLARKLLRPAMLRGWQTGFRPDLLRNAASIWPRLLYLATYTKTFDIIPSAAENVEGAIVLTTLDRSHEDRRAAVAALREGLVRTTEFLPAPISVAQAAETYLRLRDRPAEATAAVFSWR